MRTTDNNLVRLHATNVSGLGLGALQLLKSLLPALEQCRNYRIGQIYLPGTGDLANYRRTTDGPKPIYYRRVLPNSISRFLECTALAGSFAGASPLLVLGDIPLRCRTGGQTLFVQTPHLAGPWAGNVTSSQKAKYQMSRWIFRFNLDYVSGLIVQSKPMREALEASYPQTRGRISVLRQPPPEWLLTSTLKRGRRVGASNSKLRLLYPASNYPHKNIKLLSQISLEDARKLPIEELILTIAPKDNPNPNAEWIVCKGVLRSSQLLERYSVADALLFLSESESYGLPLVEAMWLGLPILCPDLPYAKDLCGNQAIYFESGNPKSLQQAILELQKRLRSNWWPDWRLQLQTIPGSWLQVADAMLRFATQSLPISG